MQYSDLTSGKPVSASRNEGLITELAFLSRIPAAEWSTEAIPADMHIALLFSNGVIGFATTAGEAPFLVYADIAKVYGHIMIGWLPR
jgi:hypothetical protein